MAQQKFYVVWKGRKTGIFSTWQECSAQVTGFTGAEYKSFESRPTAEAAFQAAYTDYKGKQTSMYTPQMLDIIGKPIAESYSVDASCIGNPGLMEFRCVHTTTKKLIFNQGPYENGSNNIGEFLAIVHALELFKESGVNEPIYSDSETALVWVKHKKYKTTLLRDESNEQIFNLLFLTEEWLKMNEFKNQLLKWDTNAWGEIPADYGRK
ncbi:MAG: viroplasmin family protein [Anaerolineaceae bacterium]